MCTAGRATRTRTSFTIWRRGISDANEYPKIFEANRDKLSNPDKIQVGQELVIPA